MTAHHLSERLRLAALGTEFAEDADLMREAADVLDRVDAFGIPTAAIVEMSERGKANAAYHAATLAMIEDTPQADKEKP